MSSNENKDQSDQEASQRDLPFAKVNSTQDLEKLSEILRCRLPRSSNIYNMTLLQPLFQDVLSIYKLNANSKEPSDTWIVCIYIREDYGRDINISAPPDLTTITDEVRNAFMNSSIFNWSQPYCFSSIQRPISSMLVEISCINGNFTSISPCEFYYFPVDQINDLSPANLAEENTEIKSLNSTEGVQFMCDTWTHSKEGSKEYIEKVLSRIESSGISVSGKLVSGILTSGNGSMGMLFTLEEFRNRNYGKVCMHALIRKLVDRNLFPCSIVEASNKISIGFHQKIGMKFSHPVDVIFYQG